MLKDGQGLARDEGNGIRPDPEALQDFRARPVADIVTDHRKIGTIRVDGRTCLPIQLQAAGNLETRRLESQIKSHGPAEERQELARSSSRAARPAVARLKCLRHVQARATAQDMEPVPMH